MSVSINNLFNYSRSLPVPFDTMTNKKVKVASMYGAKTESTLCGSVIKAVHAMCRCMNGTGEGAVGQIDTNKSVAEYKSSVGPDAYHLVVFDAASGSALASVYDKNTELIEQYVAHPSQRDGAAIFFALMPFLMSDAEFDETFQEYYDQFIAGYPDMAKATESMAILCDNAYRRIKDDTCPAHINITVDKSGNLMRVSQGQLDSGSFVPTSVTAGEFTIFAKTGPAVIKKAGVVVEHTDFVGKYPLTPGRTLSALELSLIPKLPEWYIIPPEVVDIFKHAQKTTGRPMQIDLSKISGARKNVWWYAAKTGKLEYVGEFDSKAVNFQHDSGYISGNDQVLIAVDASKDYVQKGWTELPDAQQKWNK